MSKLVLYMPDGSTRDIFLSRERIRIGRRPDNDIPLPFPAVSGEHAAIVTILADSFLEDLGSTNGTFVNGKSINKHFLRDRDRKANSPDANLIFRKRQLASRRGPAHHVNYKSWRIIHHGTRLRVDRLPRGGRVSRRRRNRARHRERRL